MSRLLSFIAILLIISHSAYNQDPILADASVPAVEEPMYMLTYDHGGLILWGADHFRERLRNAVEWLDRYPDFKIGLDNEAHVYDYFAEHEPDLLQEIKGYLEKYNGRFGIGSCTYGQPLSVFIGGESNIRQVGYALDANKKYFNYSNSIYLMSEHAMHAQIPQIIDGFGFKGAIMRTHYMMYGYNPTFDEPFGWWVGLDGSRVPTVPTYKGEGAEFSKTPVDNWILTRYPGPECDISLEDFKEQFRDIKPLLATRADDSGLRREELVQQYEGNPGYRWILLDEMLSLYPEPEAEFVTRPNDFKVRMPWGYCGNEIWNTSRKAEVQVLTAERLGAISYLLKGEYKYEFAIHPFNDSWKKADLHRKAITYNFPVLHRSSIPGDGLIKDQVDLINIGSDHVILSAFYTENGKVIARMYESHGEMSEVPVDALMNHREIHEVDLAGNIENEFNGIFMFKPWQIKTIQIAPSYPTD